MSFSPQKMPVSILDNFKFGMDRLLPDFLPAPPGLAVDLGAGQKIYEDGRRQIIRLDKNNWDGENFAFLDESVSCFTAFHFLEHLQGIKEVQKILKGVERCLCPGGIFNVLVPFYKSQIAFEDLDHKTFWTGETFKNLLNNRYYGDERVGSRLVQRSQLIMGLVERNMVVLTQLVKEYRK